MYTPLLQQLTDVAQAPVLAIMSGKPLQDLGATRYQPAPGVDLADWPFGEGLPRSTRGLMTPTPGAAAPIVPVGLVPGPDTMPNTGYLMALPERQSGRIIEAKG